MRFEGSGREGGARGNAKMAASLDDDLDLNNQDYYSLLNVRKEVWFVSWPNITKLCQKLQYDCLFDFCEATVRGRGILRSVRGAWCRCVIQSIKLRRNAYCRYHYNHLSWAGFVLFYMNGRLSAWVLMLLGTSGCFLYIHILLIQVHIS